jgi:hypothetical protein
VPGHKHPVRARPSACLRPAASAAPRPLCAGAHAHRPAHAQVRCAPSSFGGALLVPSPPHLPRRPQSAETDSASSGRRAARTTPRVAWAARRTARCPACNARPAPTPPATLCRAPARARACRRQAPAPASGDTPVWRAPAARLTSFASREPRAFGECVWGGGGEEGEEGDVKCAGCASGGHAVGSTGRAGLARGNMVVWGMRSVRGLEGLVADGCGEPTLSPRVSSSSPAPPVSPSPFPRQLHFHSRCPVLLRQRCPKRGRAGRGLRW